MNELRNLSSVIKENPAQVHPSAIVDSGAELDSGVIVGPGAVIGSEVMKELNLLENIDGSLLKKTISINPIFTEAHIVLGMVLKSLNKLNEAQIYLSKAIELDDNLILAKTLLGRTYAEMGDYDKAMEIFTSALEQTEKLGDKLFVHFQAHLALGRQSHGKAVLLKTVA